MNEIDKIIIFDKNKIDNDEVIICKTCKNKMEIGTFRAACKNCLPFYFKECYICKQIRLECCC